MRVDLRKPFSWDKVNDELQSHFGVENPMKVYQSVSHALLEIAMSLQLLYSHKKQFYHSLGLGTHADDALLFLARQGSKGLEYQVDVVPAIDDKKTLFCVSDLDDALTAEVYQDRAQSLLDPKVFRIWISHHSHLVRTPDFHVGDTDILVFATARGMAVAVLGKRAQNLHSLVAPTLDWTGMSKETWPFASEAAEWVQRVEGEKWGGGTPLLEASSPRVHDRAILTWTNLDAGALRDLLIQDGKIQPEFLEALSLSRWNETKLIVQFQKRGLSPEKFRGTLLISSELSKTADFRDRLEKAVDYLQRMGRGG